MRLGFYAWNLFQIQHVAALLRRLDEAVLCFHVRSGTDVDAILKHPSIADVADRAEILRDRDIPLLDRRLDALVFQTLFPGIETLDRPRLIGLQYSMAKERHQYGAWRAIADLTLVYGPWSAERIAPFSPVVQVGNPRWSDHFAAPVPSLAELVPGYDSSKRTLLYLPTWEELSSIGEFGEAIAALREHYNLLFAPHHNSHRFESERTAAAMRAISGNATTIPPVDVGHLIRASDVVLSDFSGAIFDAILFEKPVMLLQSDALSKIGRKFGPESIEFQRRDEIGPVVEHPEHLPGRLDDLLSGRLDYTAAHRRLRQDCFAAAHESADLAVAALRQALQEAPARPIPQTYIAELCRESQARQTRLRALQRRRGRKKRPAPQAFKLLHALTRATDSLRDASTASSVADASLRARLVARLLPSGRLLKLAQQHEARGTRTLSKAYTLAALAKGTRRSLGWTTQLFLREGDERWRLAVLDLLLSKPPGALAPLLLRANRLQNISGLRRIEFAQRRQEIREQLRNRPQARLRDVRVAFANRWLEDAQALADRVLHDGEQVGRYRQALSDTQDRLREFTPLTEIANRNEMENLARGHFECIHAGRVTRLDELPPDTLVVELPLPPYFYSQTVTEPQAHERICRFLRRVYTEVFASDVAVLPRHQYALTHTDPSGQADVTLSYHTAGEGPGHWHLKDSALPGYFTLDPQGYAGWSSIARMSELPPEVEAVSPEALEANLQALRRETVEVNQSKYAQPERGGGQELPESFIFLPLQVLDDAVQQLARIPLPELLTILLDYTRTRHVPLVLKRHPACSDPQVEEMLNRAEYMPGVTLTIASIHDILPKACAVVTINSGVGLEALVHERPVIVAGSAEYAYACEQVGSATEVRNALDRLKFDDAWRQRVHRFLYYYRQNYLIHGEDVAEIRRRLLAVFRLPTIQFSSAISRPTSATR